MIGGARLRLQHGRPSPPPRRLPSKADGSDWEVALDCVRVSTVIWRLGSTILLSALRNGMTSLGIESERG